MKRLSNVPHVAVVSLLLAGCATLNPGADPFVVRVEQTQTAAGATIDMVLRIDNADRGMWKSNAPAFHNFCEWMRTPTPYGSNTLPRSVVLQLNVDDLKLAYRASRSTGSSNALYSAWSVLQTVFSQSASWSNIISNPVHP
jgi:hypothetical protein